MIGQSVSHYKIVEELGAGGMGVVYRAEDTTLKRTVALKFLPPELTRDKDAKARFVNEAHAASALQHNNICTIHEIDETEDGRVFICMDCYDGETLEEKVARGPLAVDKALDVTAQITAGLAKAHGAGIIHRDIKSANVILTSDGVAKILDFGLAKLAGAKKVTKTGDTVGTVAYMSPEQTRGEDVDARSDIFSLSVVLYELLVGFRPFRGEQDVAVSYAVVNEDPVAPRLLRSAIPEDLEQLVLKCLEKDREKRFQSTEELAAELDKTRSEGRKRKRRLGYRSLAIGGLVGLVVILGVIGSLRWLPRHRTPVEPKSIAVLPFTNLSGDPENEYFSDGVTEDILTQLSKIADLTVVSRTSVMRYKNTAKSLREIGAELGVATILEGSVRRAGDRVRIVGQLVDARGDKHLWAEAYDREFEDIFEIQSDVAKKIAAALAAELSPKERERIERKPTADLAAYDYYLKGREYYVRYNKQDNERALELYQKALELDPNYALALGGAADACAQRVQRFGFAGVWVDSAMALAEKALSIDPELAEAHRALGSAYFMKGWFRRALESFHRAVEINPNYYAAVGNIGASHFYLGETAEAMPWFKRSVALNPTQPVMPTNIGAVYLEIGDYDKGKQWFHRALKIAPDYARAEFLLGQLYLLQGNDRQAAEQNEKAIARHPDDIWGLTLAGHVALALGREATAKACFEKVRTLAPDSQHVRYADIRLSYLLWTAGEEDEARKILRDSYERLEQKFGEGDREYDVSYAIASICAMRGDTGEACEWLQEAIDSGYRNFRWISIDPLFENLHGDPLFEEMMAQLQAKVDGIREEIETIE